MTGAEIILKTASELGIETCFVNAGTTELPLVAAFDSIGDIRPVLGLFEGVCSGAADGYARMLQKPAMCLTHLGPGLANAIANLHNARRARSPVLNIVGDHASWHLCADAPLTMDIASLAKTFSGWQRHSSSADNLAQDTADALAAARQGNIATLIAACDHQWTQSGITAYSVPESSFSPPDQDAVFKAAAILRSANKPALLLGGSALREPGLITAARIKAATGCSLLIPTFPAYAERGVGIARAHTHSVFP